jgi:phosphoribosylformylglycinamidine cyclo-ligase
MGAGFALYCAAGAGGRLVELAGGLGLSALVAGRVEEGPRRVVLEPVEVRFADDELELSAG